MSRPCSAGYEWCTEDNGGSHWHCGRCERVSGMMGCGSDAACTALSLVKYELNELPGETGWFDYPENNDE